MFTMIVLSGATSLIAPVLLQIWKQGNRMLSIDRILFVVFIIIASRLLNMILIVYRERFAKEFNKQNFVSMMKDYFALKYETLISDGPTNLLERISIAVNSIYFYMTGDYIQIYSSFFVAAVCLVLVAFVNVWLALLMLSVIPLNYYGFKLLNSKLKQLSEGMQKDTSAGFQEILSRVQHIDYIKQTAFPERQIEGLGSAVEKVYASMARVNEFARSVSVGLRGTTEVIQTIVVLSLIYFFSASQLDSYDLLLTVIVLPLYFSSVSSIVNSNINKRDYQVAVDFQHYLESQRERTDQGCEGAAMLDRIDLDVKGLEIADRTIPFHAAGRFVKGDIIRICGESGCGKSTFAKALLRFRDAEGISINGLPIQSLRIDHLRERIEYVPQNTPIFCGTLRDNLLINLPQKESWDEALMQFPLLEGILKTKTLDTMILENGANLSGGEKQMIALTRAFLENPDVLIPDEVCSNIDARTTDAIYRYLDSKRKDHILFIISHEDLPQGLANHHINRPESMGAA